MVRVPFILGPILLLGWAAGDSFGQSRSAPSDSAFRTNAQKASRMSTAPRFTSRSFGNRGPLSTFETSRYSGIITIPEQARSLLARPPRFSKFDISPLPTTPVQRFLEQKNLLSVRSSLARKTTSTVGRNDFVTDRETGRMYGDMSEIERQAASYSGKIDPLRPDSGAFQNAIVRRLEAKAKEYYELGTSAFRQGKLIQASGYFDLVRDVETSRTRAFLAKVIVGVQKEDYASAYVNLLRAIDVASDVNDLKIDIPKFYKPEEFRRRVELMNLRASRAADNALAATLQSYYLWLNGDVGTALSAAISAEKNSPGDAGKAMRKFREMLIKQRTAPTAQPSGPISPSTAEPKPAP